MAKLKKKAKAAWVEALRSGKYEQGKGRLNQDGKFCCLGVLCEVAIESGVDVKVGGSPYATYTTYDDSSLMPPKSVTDWAYLKRGVDKALPGNASIVYRGRPHYLSELNDWDYLSFKEIADLIEKHL